MKKWYVLAMLLGAISIAGCANGKVNAPPAERLAVVQSKPTSEQTVPSATLVIWVRSGDETMRAIENARVEVTGPTGELFQAKTDAKGIVLVEVPAELTKGIDGRPDYPLYTVVVQASGYKKLTLTGIQARYDDNSGAEIPMAPGEGEWTIHDHPKFRPPA